MEVSVPHKHKEYICANCGTKFMGRLRPGRAHRFCSLKCFYEFNKRPKNERFRTCEQCGHMFYLKRTSRSGIFCSWACCLAARNKVPKGKVMCPICRKIFSRTKSRRLTCSTKCLRAYQAKLGRRSRINYRALMPPHPTNAYPGTPEKIDVMCQRVAAGQSPFHPDDPVVNPARIVDIEVPAHTYGWYIGGFCFSV